MAVFICTCCGSEVTVPYFFGNGVYGWSCIKKVNPAAKKRARNILVKADKIEWVGNNVIAHLYGKRLNVTTYAQRYAADRELSVEQKNGYFYVYYHSTKRWYHCCS